MTMWLIRAGKAGEREKLALDNKAAVIGWEELQDLTPCKTRDALAALLKATYPDQKPKTLMNWESQIWPIRETIKVGDLVVLPLQSRADIVFGKITGGYQYRTDLPGGPFHSRPMEWLKEFPRSHFDKDLLFSFGAFMTVCRIERNNAEQRINAMLEGKKWVPMITTQGGGKSQGAPMPGIDSAIDQTDATALPDIEEQSQDLIRERIAQRFKGHALATLVAAILEAQGYRAITSPPGADGGVDIMAGSGPLGFDAPRLIAQVKSQDSQVDVKVVRELTGVMGKFHADHALLVAWGGFNKAARAEVAADYFKLRLWDAGNLVKALQDYY
jgi:restriction system protein